MKKVTVSVRHGGYNKVRRNHNLRTENILKAEKHIDSHGHREVWHDESEKDAYERVFKEAQDVYNSKQTRAERKIKDYLEKVKNDPKKHAIYEAYVSVGNKDNRLGEEEERAILKKYFEGWKDRNPNMEIVGCYYHADERGVSHLHIDYIPVAHGYAKGMETQNGMRRACEQMGFTTTWEERESRKGETYRHRVNPQEQWHKSEREFLKELVIERGYEILYTNENKVWMEKQVYEANREHEKVRAHTKNILDINESLIDEINERSLEKRRLEAGIEELIKRAHAILENTGLNMANKKERNEFEEHYNHGKPWIEHEDFDR